MHDTQSAASKGGIYKTIITGINIDNFPKGGIYKTISTGKNIAKLSRGGVFKNQNYRYKYCKIINMWKFIKPSVQAETIQNYQQVEVLNQD